MHSNPQNPGPELAIDAAIAGALDWWREAGVDLSYHDAAQSWITAPEPAVASPTPGPPAGVTAPRPAAAPPAPLGGDRARWPQGLTEFAAWWLAEPTIDPAPPTMRVPPTGPIRAAVMVLVEYPEADDREGLLTGPQGKLLRQMLRAMGYDPGETYFASALPRHMPLPDWAQLSAVGLGEIVAHHIALAQPQRLILFGANVSSLLGHDPANSAESLHRINQEGSTIPVLCAPPLDLLQARPARKAALWQRWLNWTGRKLT